MLPCQYPTAGGTVGRVWTRRTSPLRQEATKPALPTKALVIHALASAKPERPHLEAIGGIEEITLDEEHPGRAIQLGREMEVLIIYILYVIFFFILPTFTSLKYILMSK